VTYQKSGSFDAFAGRGFSRRELFTHKVIAVPKPYPDAQLLLERRGLRRHELEKGQFYQLNLYTTDFYRLPDELFSHPEINWHRQNFGQKGLIAAAGLWIRNSVATISTLQSDVCQQLYRHPTLNRLCKTQVETHFKYWYAILFNAVLDFCTDLKIITIHSPTGHQIVANTQKAVNPDLFYRIYDYPSTQFHCRKISVGSAEYWEIPIDANRALVARLDMSNHIEDQEISKVRICIFHDVEEDVDTEISSAECADNLTHMLQVERSFGLKATYNILGTLFSRKNDEIRISNPDHAIGFHSFNHHLWDLAQLSQCRAVDLRVRGYRPPQSRITSELTEYNLTRFNFEWLASSVNSLGRNTCKLENGIVKIPIHLDDYSLSLAKPYGQWESELLSAAQGKSFLGLGLHDCYAGKWLTRYPDLLDKLATKGQFVSADEVCDSIFMGEPVTSSHFAGRAASRVGFARLLYRKMAEALCELIGTK
jgi:hypothetical protein